VFSLSSVLFLSLFETTKFSLLFLFVVLHRVWFLGYPKIASRTYALHVCTVLHVCFHKVNFSLSVEVQSMHNVQCNYSRMSHVQYNTSCDMET